MPHEQRGAVMNVDNSPVHRLPPEVLEQVFSSLQTSVGWTWSVITQYSVYGRATWIRVTSVCRHWHLVALQSPQLWALVSLDIVGASFLPAYLGRSRTLPLSVTIRCGGPVLSSLLHHASRIRRLEIQGLAGVLPRLIGTLEFLEEASLSNAYAIESPGPTVHFRRDDFPRLRKLSLSQVRVAWDAFSLPSLHELSVGYPPQFISATTLLRIMRDSPGLRVLSFLWRRDAPSAPVGDLQATDVVSLMHLENVALTGTLQNITDVLDRIIGIPSGKFTIRVRYDMEASVHGVHSLQMFLPRQLAFQSLLPHCTTVSLVVPVEVIITAFDASRTSLLEIKLVEEIFGGVPALSEEAWTSFLDTFSPSLLSRFSLRYRFLHSISSQMWSAMFARFPCLQTVEIKFCGDHKGRGTARILDNMFAALREPCALQVRTLELRNLALSPYTTGALFGLLDDRAAMGAPMERLDFFHCFCEDTLDTRDVKTRLESYAGLALSIGYSVRGVATESDEFRVFPSR